MVCKDTYNLILAYLDITRHVKCDYSKYYQYKKIGIIYHGTYTEKIKLHEELNIYHVGREIIVRLLTCYQALGYSMQNISFL